MKGSKPRVGGEEIRSLRLRPDQWVAVRAVMARDGCTQSAAVRIVFDEGRQAKAVLDEVLAAFVEGDVDGVARVLAARTTVA